MTMVGNANKSFVDMVVSRNLIESTIKGKKLKTEDSLSSKKRGHAKKKEKDTQAVFLGNQLNESYALYSVYRTYSPYYPTINNVTPTPYFYQPPKPINP